VVEAIVGVATGVTGAALLFNDGEDDAQGTRAKAGAGSGVSSPLRVATEFRRFPEDAQGWVYPVPLSADQEAALLAVSSYNEAKWPLPKDGLWIARQSGASLRTFTRMRLTVENPSDASVLVKEIKARVRRSPPMAGAIIWRGTQGESEIPQIGFDLDETDSIARVRDDKGTLGDPYTRRKTIFLEPKEVMLIDVTAETARHLCEWHLELTVLVGGVNGRTETVTVDKGGRPFRTSALAPEYAARYAFDTGGGTWRALGSGTGANIPVL
jgi:hypothetical protein